MTPSEVKHLLLSVGFPVTTIKLFVAQAAHECGSIHFNSHVAQVDNNLTGINFINKPSQINATMGSLKPANEDSAHYAHFATLMDWANDYKRILSFGAMPIMATTTEDLVSRLRRNNYFTDHEYAYKKGVNNWYNKLGDSLDV